MILTRSLSVRRIAPRSLTQLRFFSFKDKLMELRLAHSREPPSYTSGLPIVPRDLDQTGHEHKKVTVVGCGQVGMAIAVSWI
jgi:hypothetical protein